MNYINDLWISPSFPPPKQDVNANLSRLEPGRKEVRIYKMAASG